jgi:hypothetical protein
MRFQKNIIAFVNCKLLQFGALNYLSLFSKQAILVKVIIWTKPSFHFCKNSLLYDLNK